MQKSSKKFVINLWLSMMTLWTGSKELHWTSDDKIDPNDEGEELTWSNREQTFYGFIVV